jgi:arginine N-succinyltransferase
MNIAARIRPGRADDLEALYEMAKRAGNGFTNLPADRTALAAKLSRSEAALNAPTDEPGDQLFLLMLEDLEENRLAGTAQIMARVGETVPFYSYRRGTLTQHSTELGRSFRAEMLTLTTDLEGSSEVGGLFLHPHYRSGGLGLLLARSRYLFIRQHRARFADRLLAELRGVIDEAGASPFWDGLAGRFFGMGFQEADAFNAVNGHQFIADLMPKHPIYIAMLTEAARAVIGVPHPTGRPAMRMLEGEGFSHQGYLDIFDGGPTMCAQTDRVRTIADARVATLRATDLEGGDPALISTGRLHEFRAALGRVEARSDGVRIDPTSAASLQTSVGAELLHVAR